MKKIKISEYDYEEMREKIKNLTEKNKSLLNQLERLKPFISEKGHKTGKQCENCVHFLKQLTPTFMGDVLTVYCELNIKCPDYIRSK